MATLKEKAQRILAEKQSKIIPTNIKETVQIFDVTGTYEGQEINNQDKTITTNGTYTADAGYTGLGEVTVNVSGGGTVVSKGVDFIDYDGTLLYSYTPEEVQALTELPEGPTHNRLIFDGWNWTLEDIKAHNRNLTIGATYDTTSGLIEVDIELVRTSNMTITFSNPYAATTDTDWGDGTVDTLLTHTYNNPGTYTIKLNQGLAGTQYFFNPNGEDDYRIKRIFIPKGIPILGSNTFRNLMALETVTTANDVVTINGSAFYNDYNLKCFIFANIDTLMPETFSSCHCLEHISLNNNLTWIRDDAFDYCNALKELNLPNSVSTISQYCFYECFNITNLVMPTDLTSITDSNIFSGMYSIKIIDFTNFTSIPNLTKTDILDYATTNVKIIVPDTLYDDWIVATNWSVYADYIYKASEV